MQQQVRYFTVTLPFPGNAAVANEVAGYEFQQNARVLEAELFLGTTGTGAGSTSVDVKKNGTSIFAANMAIASASATKRVRKAPNKAVGEPSGLSFAKGDYARVDVTAIPGTTTSTNGFVTLFCCSEV